MRAPAGLSDSRELGIARKHDAFAITLTLTSSSIDKSLTILSSLNFDLRAGGSSIQTICMIHESKFVARSKSADGFTIFEKKKVEERGAFERCFREREQQTNRWKEEGEEGKDFTLTQ